MSQKHVADTVKFLPSSLILPTEGAFTMPAQLGTHPSPDDLRGFAAGTAVGDTLVASSVELRLPLTSPLNIGKIGVSAYVDTGTVYNKGQQLSDQTFRNGIGGSLWLSAAFVRANIAVAHGIGSSTRVHVGGSLTF